MSSYKICFRFEDFYDQPPDPGLYSGSISSARFSRSAGGNRMLKVVHALEGVEPAYQLVAEYFVLEGERLSPLAVFLARRRLVELYRACRIFPKEGDTINPAQLVGARLQVGIEHEEWEGRTRLRVAGYRPLEEPSASGEEIPF